MQLHFIENKIKNTDAKTKYVVKEKNSHKFISTVCAKLSNTNLDHI